jgi:hypothetical protein
MTRRLLSVLCLSALFLAPGCSDSSTPAQPDAAADGPAVNEEAGVDMQPDQAVAVDNDGDGHKSDVDCDDNDDKVHPGAVETCNGKDDDCDGKTDEDDASDAKTWYLDQDSDTYGDPKTSKLACAQPAGYVADDTDCDDTKNTVNPAATEACNGVDDNCDGSIDEDGATGAKDWYPDGDGDGYGDDAGLRKACGVPSGHVLVGGDCNDADKAINPGASELCFGAGNGVDDDCDGTIDEADATDAVVFYRDSDSDGYGDPADTKKGCLAPTGYVSNADDCNDQNNTIKPGVVDLPDDNAADTNCDQVDGDLAHAIFVSTTGNDADDGKGKLLNGVLVVAPVLTLAKALTLADACMPDKCYVLIAEGTYDQATTTLDLKDGVSLYGGYAAIGWGRTATRDKLVISGSVSPTLRATSLALATRVERLTIVGPDFSAATTPGLESIAAVIDATPSPGIFTLKDVQITAGKGSPGTPGVDGKHGVDKNCTACAGGIGGVSSICWDDKPTQAGAKGGCGGGNGGATGYDTCQNICGLGPPLDGYLVRQAGPGAAGSNGGNGGNGGSGGAAGSPAFGSFVATDWQPALSTAGADGGNGKGGGGGGSGGHYRWWCEIGATHSADLPGGTGGKGGDGGCGADAGTAGQPGGAAFGLVMVQSTATLDALAIALGTGGKGGDGGTGGPLSLGANGGGGSTQWRTWFGDSYSMSSGAGAKGGTGGYGGGGAGGAGGNGGPSIGFVVIGPILPNGLPTYDQTGGAAGLGGVGGSGGKNGALSVTAPAGAPGADGQLQDFLKI